MHKKYAIPSKFKDLIQQIANYYACMDNPPPSRVIIDPAKIMADHKLPGIYYVPVTTEVEYIPMKPKQHSAVMRVQLDQHNNLVFDSVRFV